MIGFLLCGVEEASCGLELRARAAGRARFRGSMWPWAWVLSWQEHLELAQSKSTKPAMPHAHDTRRTCVWEWQNG